MKQISFFFIASIILMACQSNKNTTIDGATTSKHGCIETAGYTWSELKSECIRLFESAQCIGAIRSGSATFNTYVVFSDDNSKAELFMPDLENQIILQYDGKNCEGSGSELTKSNDKYSLMKDGKEVKFE